MLNHLKPKVALINIGTELLAGKVQNTNAYFLLQELDKFSFPVTRQITVHDNCLDILRTLRQLEGEASIVIVTGGIGPTFDDVTTSTLAHYAHEPLVLNTKLLKDIRRLVHKQGRRIKNVAIRQAWLPKNATLLNNRVGVASGFILPSKKFLLAALPGVPREMEEMLISELLPTLDKKFQHRVRYRYLTLKTVGVNEAKVVTLVKKSVFTHPKLRWGIYPGIGEVVLRVYFEKRHSNIAKKIFTYCANRLKKFVYTTNESDDLPTVIGRRLTKCRLTVATAESLTGGSLGKRLTEMPGASRYFLGGVAAYSNKIKESLLGISRKLLAKHGAVSKPAALAMASGVRTLMGTKIGVGITGIAGPTGGSRVKPVGTVHIAVALSGKKVHRMFRFNGDREQIRNKATQAALQLLFNALQKV